MTFMSAYFSRSLSLIFRHELRVLHADRTLYWMAGLLLVLIGYSLFTGLAETRTRDAAALDIAQRQVATQGANIAAVRKVMAGKPPVDPFSNPVDPANMGGGLGARYAVMPTAPLAPLAFGQSDMFPNSYKVTYRSKVTFMYDSEMENPWNLLSGHLDLAFVMTYLLPLLIFATSYNLLSVEREQGTLRMLLSQPLRLTTLVLGKVGARAAVLLGVAVLTPALIAILVRPEVRESASILSLLAWMGLIVAYGVFWFALAVFVNSFGKSSATNALILVSAWVALVLIVPVVLNMVVQAQSPAPSRTELATRTRVITIQGLNRYNELLSADYRYAATPGILLPKDGKIVVPDRMRGHYLIQRDVDTEIETVLDRFDAQLAGQQRLVDRYGVLSPAIIVYEGMTALAGTGSKRYASFQQQVDDFHALWKAYFDPRVMNGIAITEDDFARMPTFKWREPMQDGTVFATLQRMALLGFPVLVMLLVAAWRLKRMRIV